MDDERHKWEQLASYFAGDCGEDEQRSLETWLHQATDKEKEQYVHAKRLWESAGSSGTDYSPDIKRGWQQLQLKIRLREKNKKRFPLLRIAAAVSLLILSSILLINYSLSGPDTIKVLAGKEIELAKLPDGSKIWLNAGASLSYSEDYGINNREVHLIGEAFFEVEKAEGKRFTIFTETTKTEVIGTSFNLRALPNEPVKVQVTTGKVAFSDLKSQEAVFLEPGQEAVYSPSEQNQIVSTPITDPNYRAWQNKELVFKNTRLPDLASTLEGFFDTKILVPDHLKDCRFTASFKTPQLKDVLDVLALTSDLKITKTPEGYAFSGNACDNK